MTIGNLAVFTEFIVIIVVFVIHFEKFPASTSRRLPMALVNARQPVKFRKTCGLFGDALDGTT
jgi:hypothetical protein